jgi:predicted acylesterase/phospholipase RssA
MNIVDLALSLTEAMPAGLYEVMALEAYVRTLLSTPGCRNEFDELDPELYIIATDLDSGERVVFGRGGDVDADISMAVAASSAVPLLYKPVRIGDQEFVDGGLRGTASLDLAIERGANLVICINPLVPFDNRSKDSIPFLGPDGGYLSEKGGQFIAAQVMRIVIHSGLHYHIKQLRRQHPEVDIILVEPRADDTAMFFHNIMRYSSRLTVARHGFESVTLDLAEDYPHYKSILDRHGIPISRRLVISELAEIQDSGYAPETIRRILESRPAGSIEKGRRAAARRLSIVLSELDTVLNDRKAALG